MAEDYGIKISQDGFDVKTCDDKDLIMTSKLNLLKTKATGVTSVAVAHGLDYTPIFFSTSEKNGSGSGQYSFIGSDGHYVDDTNFHPLYASTRYYIFYQEAIS